MRLLSVVLALGALTGFPSAPVSEPSRAPSPVAVPGPPTMPARWAYRDPSPAVKARHGAVACVSEVASRIGAEVLERGGNAIDAAVAVAFALAVVYPEAGNVGGGGFMLIRTASGESAALDYRETAPSRASRTMYQDVNGNVSSASRVGALASGVPGTVAGLEAAHKRYGRRPWAELVAPAIRLAQDGFLVSPYLAASMARSEDVLLRFAETRRVLMPGERLPRVQQRLKQPDLAKTLARIAREGARGFYQGPVAAAIADDQAHMGGLITQADLAGYQARWRSPVSFTYRGHRVFSMPPPSSGGVAMAEILNILEGFDLAGAGWHSAKHLHWLVEAQMRAFADRNAYLADPDFIKGQPVDTLISKEYAAMRRATIPADRATHSREVGPGLEPEHTTHFSVIDAAGNAVSNTYTLNGNFGSGVIVKGTGVLMNNEMDDFTAKPGTPNMFGLVQGERNAIAPGKRMLSSMSPAIVLDPEGHLELAIGSPGGSTIPTTVAQVLSNVIDFQQPLNWAIAAPRLHHQHQPDITYHEPDGLDPATLGALVRFGHQVNRRDYIGDAMGVRRMADGTLEAYADPRRGGLAVGY